MKMSAVSYSLGCHVGVWHINKTNPDFNHTSFLKFSNHKETTTGGGGVLSMSSNEQGNVVDDGDNEKPNRIYGGHFDDTDTKWDSYIYTVRTNGGVEAKFQLAMESGMDESIGIDLVATSLNDLITVGPNSRFFFMYNATGFTEKVISCMADACKQCGPRFHFSPFEKHSYYTTLPTAMVKKDSIIDGKNIEVGDVLIALPSSGIHSNGFLLVRRVLELSGSSLKDNLPGTNITVGESLMTPTVIYNKRVIDIIRTVGGVKGIAHIAGGGVTENITRVLPPGLGAVIFKNSWVIPPIFKWIQEVGSIEDVEMRRNFNMGIGMVLVVSQESASRLLRNKTVAYHVGEVVRGKGVTYGYDA